MRKKTLKNWFLIPLAISSIAIAGTALSCGGLFSNTTSARYLETQEYKNVVKSKLISFNAKRISSINNNYPSLTAEDVSNILNNGTSVVDLNNKVGSLTKLANIALEIDREETRANILQLLRDGVIQIQFKLGSFVDYNATTEQKYYYFTIANLLTPNVEYAVRSSNLIFSISKDEEREIADLPTSDSLSFSQNPEDRIPPTIVSWPQVQALFTSDNNQTVLQQKRELLMRAYTRNILLLKNGSRLNILANEPFGSVTTLPDEILKELTFALLPDSGRFTRDHYIVVNSAKFGVATLPLAFVRIQDGV